MGIWEGQGFLEGWHSYVTASEMDLLYKEQVVTRYGCMQDGRKSPLWVDGNQAGVGVKRKNSRHWWMVTGCTVGEWTGRHTALQTEAIGLICEGVSAETGAHLVGAHE